ncbi:nucleoside-diphosphate kinase [Amycolatopsis rhabdoformis]|uniref:Nucleoside-diphosphate kinase n=1 Tax=Amycolatopsis rhabdoformis TaxID=1448059 RepID=A0ABZ1IF09_9PSEU|nr:nucleoside-diphosphate kinase [Amycolatopsis rhabdoformis]WSE33044.1 nucleoside-diphosphate kinase [Amycolatopsis rhabdoformis]
MNGDEKDGRRPPEALTRDADKHTRYTADTYFQESLEHLRTLTGDAARFAGAHGLLLLKPDAIAARRVMSTMDWLAENGFRVVGARRVRLTPVTLRALWYFQWNTATPQLRRIADHCAGCTDSLLLVLAPAGDQGPLADLPVPVRLTELVGPSDPAVREPGRLRTELGRYALLNLVHSSGDPADVVRDLGIYCTPEARAELVTQVLAGADREPLVRDLARAAYADSPAHDLSVPGAKTRLRREAERLLAGPTLTPAARAALGPALSTGGDEAIRTIVEATWAHHLPLPAWDITVAAAELYPMTVPGARPLLAPMTAARWRRAALHAVRHA